MKTPTPLTLWHQAMRLHNALGDCLREIPSSSPEAMRLRKARNRSFRRCARRHDAHWDTLRQQKGSEQ